MRDKKSRIFEEMCNGMSEVCAMLSLRQKDKKSRMRFEHYADRFSKFGRLFKMDELFEIKMEVGIGRETYHIIAKDIHEAIKKAVSLGCNEFDAEKVSTTDIRSVVNLGVAHVISK